VLSKVNEIETWMNDNLVNIDCEEYEAKQKELESIFNPIATKLYQGGEGGAEPSRGNPAGGPQPSAAHAGPQVDEVD
jgi:L1 cell adhesion molecule like protein